MRTSLLVMLLVLSPAVALVRDQLLLPEDAPAIIVRARTHYLWATR